MLRKILTHQILGYRLAPALGCLVCAYLLYAAVLPNLMFPAMGAALKLRGKAKYCDWYQIAMFQVHLAYFNNILQGEAADAADSFRMPDPEGPCGLIDIAGREKPFWVRPWTVKPGVGWLVAEHRWMEELEGDRMVRPGDVVFDIGAHVGFFTDTALRQGASKVVAVEPDPMSAACLQLNFPEEIAEGRVVVMEVGAWDSAGTMTLSLAEDSGWNSMTRDQVGEELTVPVLPIDDMAEQLGLTSVDFIKMDIEGAEKRALRGALRTLKNHRPRVMIDTYEWADDLDGLLAEVRRGGPYQPYCGPCEPTRDYASIIPHMTFYEVD